MVDFRRKKESRTYLDVMGYGDSTLDEESARGSQEKTSEILLFRFCRKRNLPSQFTRMTGSSNAAVERIFFGSRSRI